MCIIGVTRNMYRSKEIVRADMEANCRLLIHKFDHSRPP